MPEEAKKFYVTTPIYYVNARPHIGHAYTTIVADVLARRHRLLGDETWFLTGTDEHGQKIERSAAAAGIAPQQFADQVSAEFDRLWKRMGITNDQYIRTTDAAHKRGVQKLFATLYERGQIYLSSYTGQYSIGEEMFVEGPPGTLGPDGKPTETVTEENFFFRLSDYQLPLLDLIESDTLTITPESRKNEVLSFLRGNVSSLLLTNAQSPEETQAGTEPTPGPGLIPALTQALEAGKLRLSRANNPYIPGALKDLSISRSSFTWGIPVPEPAASLTKDPHIIYVWLDALANYMTAVGYGDDSPEGKAKFEKYWPADLHLVGKEIIRFHCVYWPAFLLAANLPLPKAIAAHGWLLFDDAKMSKSKGNIVRTETILEAFGTLCPPPPQFPTDSNPDPNPLSAQNTPVASSNPTPLLSFRSEAKESASSPTQSANPSPNPLLSFRPTPLLSFRSAAEESASSVATNPPRVTTPADAPLKGTASAVPPTQPEQAALAAEAISPSAHQRDLFAADVLRYFLLREIPFGQDGSFTFDALITRYNADLANGYGNLVSRTLSMIEKYSSECIVSDDQSDWSERDWLDYAFSKSPGFARWTSSNEVPDSNGGLQFSMYQTAEYALRCRDILSGKFGEVGFQAQLAEVSLAIRMTDGFISLEAPWKLSKQAESRGWLNEVLYTAAESIRIITALLYPILPYATASVWRQLGLGNIEEAAKKGELKNLQWGGLKPGTKLGTLSPLFPRADTSPDKGLAQKMSDIEAEKTQQAAQTKLNPPIGTSSAPDADNPASASTTHPGAPPRTGALSEPNPGAQVGGSTATNPERAHTPTHTEAPASGIFGAPNAQAAAADASPQITIDDFAKVELRVAKVLVCERIPKADKLLRLEVDLGYEKRQILSGIAEWYTPEDLLGRRIVVITNLAPRKMRGLESHGMLLAASASEGGKPSLATFLDSDDLPLGSRLK